MRHTCRGYAFGSTSPSHRLAPMPSRWGGKPTLAPRRASGGPSPRTPLPRPPLALPRRRGRERSGAVPHPVILALAQARAGSVKPSHRRGQIPAGRFAGNRRDMLLSTNNASRPVRMSGMMAMPRTVRQPHLIHPAAALRCDHSSGRAQSAGRSPAATRFRFRSGGRDEIAQTESGSARPAAHVRHPKL